VGVGADGCLERIAFDLNRWAVPINRVNPLYIKQIKQIHASYLNRMAIQVGRDLL